MLWEHEAENIQRLARSACEEYGVRVVDVLLVTSEVRSGASIGRVLECLKCDWINLRVVSFILDSEDNSSLDWCFKRSSNRYWLTWPRTMVPRGDDGDGYCAPLEPPPLGSIPRQPDDPREGQTRSERKRGSGSRVRPGMPPGREFRNVSKHSNYP